MAVTSWKSRTCQWKWMRCVWFGFHCKWRGNDQRTTSLSRKDTCSWNTMQPCEASHKEPSCEDLPPDNAHKIIMCRSICCYQSSSENTTALLLLKPGRLRSEAATFTIFSNRCFQNSYFLLKKVAVTKVWCLYHLKCFPFICCSFNILFQYMNHSN